MRVRVSVLLRRVRGICCPFRDGPSAAAVWRQTGKTDALLNFAEEEKKHIRLFERYRQAFDRGFPVKCQLLNSATTIPAAMRQVHPISGALFVLLFEWMTQSHYVESVRDDSEIDPLFKSLLKHHWMEEAQHAKLDTLIVDDLFENCATSELPQIIAGFQQLALFIDKGLQIQARFNVDAFEEAIGRRDWPMDTPAVPAASPPRGLASVGVKL